jgi:SAM-dependent methyltransferase
MSIATKPTTCAICGTFGNAREVYPANFNPEAFNPDVFSARRLPDQIHYRMVKCNACGLLRSDPIADTRLLNQLYTQSAFTYADKVEGLKTSYGRHLAKLDQWLKQKDSLLEVGCGNGFFLEEALRRGYTRVAGVEPSVSAVAKAKPEIRLGIICDIFRPGLFNAEQFDVICFFQTFDHLPDPCATLQEAYRILKPGGAILSINHNVEALSARIMGEKSPIIDIEHTYLYSPKTMAQIVTLGGFRVLKAGSAVNTYPTEYLVHLLPITGGMKKTATRILQLTGLTQVHLTLHLGNLYLIAQKPQK